MSKSVMPFIWVLMIGALVGTTYLVGKEAGKKQERTEWQDKEIKSNKKHLEQLAQAQRDSDKAIAYWRNFSEQQRRKGVEDREKMAADYARSVANSKRLQITINDLLKRAEPYLDASRATTAGKRPAKETAGELLSYVLGRLDEAAGKFASEADDARARGLQCELQYDALIQSLPSSQPKTN